MVPAGIFAIKLPVNHVRDPRERVPIGRVEAGKRPLDALRGYSLLHFPVLHHIVVIVQRYEIVAPHTTVGKNGGRHKNEADGGNLPEGRVIVGPTGRVSDGLSVCIKAREIVIMGACRDFSAGAICLAQ